MSASEPFRPTFLTTLECAHPLQGYAGGYEFRVPLLDSDHVTDDAGTGFVHTAPGHGREDFDAWTANARQLEARGISSAIPYTVDANGALTTQAPGFTGKRVLNDKGEKGDANEAVIKALSERGMLLARSRLKHQYPHSWRSKKPVIYRNTPQWFIAMDKDILLVLSPLAGEGQGGESTANAARVTTPDPTPPYKGEGSSRRHPAPSRSAGDRSHALGAAAGPEPHHGHDRRPARLGDLASARLGCTNHGVRARKRRWLR